MRPFLAFDTSTDHIALAIGDLDTPDSRLAVADFRAPRAANTVVLLAIERLLESVGITPSALAAVAVGRGPGSFTGVRIGAATAKGLAHGLGVPLVGFGTLDAVAYAATDAEGLVGVLGDAMRGEVYPALFRVHAGSAIRLTADRVVRPAEVADVARCCRRDWQFACQSYPVEQRSITARRNQHAEHDRLGRAWNHHGQQGTDR